MNKVILLSDKEQLPKGAADFACMLNEQSRILLSGVFLPQVDYWNSLFYYSYGMAVPIPYMPSADLEVAQLAVAQFEALCKRNGIEYRIHEKEYENIRQELRIETRFADLMLFSNEAFFRHLDEVTSAEYADEALHHSECPLVMLPERCRCPDNVILTYDGSSSATYAIRQFAQLMPEFAALETLLVYVNPAPAAEIPYLSYLEELVARHYPRLTIMKLDIDPARYFSTWLFERANSILVTGAQGRSSFSELFRKSFIRDLVRNHTMPVFIAHQ